MTNIYIWNLQKLSTRTVPHGEKTCITCLTLGNVTKYMTASFHDFSNYIFRFFYVFQTFAQPCIPQYSRYKLNLFTAHITMKHTKTKQENYIILVLSTIILIIAMALYVSLVTFHLTDYMVYWRYHLVDIIGGNDWANFPSFNAPSTGYHVIHLSKVIWFGLQQNRTLRSDLFSLIICCRALMCHVIH
jgi:hypothetical protein